MTFNTYTKLQFSITYDTFFVFYRILLNISNAEDKSTEDVAAISLLKNQTTETISFFILDDFAMLQDSLLSLSNFAYESVDEFVATVDRGNEARREIAGMIDVIQHIDTTLSIFPSEIEFCAFN